MPALDYDYRKYWKTKTGELILYEDMNNQHLIHSHNMLANKLIDWTNYCMSKNEEMDPPDYIMEIVECLESQLRERGLLINDSKEES